MSPYKIIWKFKVRKEREKEFEEAYSPTGLWAELFKKGKGYRGTELLRDEKERSTYLTVDTWDSETDFENFKARWKSAYEVLDRQLEGLADSEVPLGSFIPIKSRQGE